MDYERGRIERGYNRRTLYINLSTNDIREKPVDDRMIETFTGGRGFDLWLLWNSLPRDRITRWNDPENELCVACGPLGGTTIYPGSGKSIVASISPLTESVLDSNVGGFFGPYLKFSGFDAIEIQGRAERDAIVVVDGDAGEVRVEEAGGLPEDTHLLGPALGEKFGAGNPRSVASVTTGRGAEHSLWGCLNFSYYDLARRSYRFKQAGRGGLGTVMRMKRLRALVARFSGLSPELNHPADPEGLKSVGRKYNAQIRELDPKQNEMAAIGTTHLITIMNDHDLLPVHNFKFGSHLDAPKLGKEVFRKMFHPGYDGCWVGCSVACSHPIKDFVPRTGPYRGQRVWVDGPEYETIAGCGSNLGVFDPDFVAEMNFYCDTYGLDTISVGTGFGFVMECFERGLISRSQTGGLELRFGNADAALELLHMVARGEGFGAVVGKGIRRMKRHFAESFGADPGLMEDIGMEAKGLEFSEYITKESLAQQGGYGLALKGPQHDEAWLIFLDMVHGYLPTFEKKAEALHWFPMWRTWFGLCGLCKLPWNDIVPPENKQTPEPAKVMQHVEWYAEFFTATTGRKVSPPDLIKMSERVYNFQRVFNLRMGFGTRESDRIPYRAMGPVTEEEYESRRDRYDAQLKEKGIMSPEGRSTREKLEALRRYREEQYERLIDAVYERRGWTRSGVPRVEKLRELGIDFPDVVELVKKHQ
ncbi:MAG: aldehyde ferredoxin oxidoreductase family protein [Thermoplasmatota archaeon]